MSGCLGNTTIAIREATSSGNPMGSMNCDLMSFFFQLLISMLKSFRLIYSG